MTTLVVDIETNGLLGQGDRIHVIVTKDLDSKLRVYHDDEILDSHGSIKDGLQSITSCKNVVFHNGLGFDIPFIESIYPEFKFNNKIHDTYILSQMLFANDMQLHGLDAWGKVFKRPKPVHTDWDRLTEEMIHRCKEDVQITDSVWELCKKKATQSGCDMRSAVDLEYRVYKGFCSAMNRGWEFDCQKADTYISRLSRIQGLISDRIVKKMPLTVTPGRTIEDPLKKDGDLKQTVKNKTGSWGTQPSGPFTYVDISPINLNSSSQVQSALLKMGWKPDEFNYKKDSRGKVVKGANGQPIITSPKLSGSSYKGVPEEIASTLKKQSLVKHRLGVLKNWSSKAKSNSGLLPIFAYTCGCNTSRFRHKALVNVPKADSSVFLGRTMRSLFKCPEGYIIVGCDAQQLETRVEAALTYRYDDGEYATSILQEDVHQKTADLFNISRSQAKAINYGIAYGAGPGKIKSMLEVSMDEARDIHTKYWQSRPAALALKRDLEKQVASQGFSESDNLYNSAAFIKGIDGRPIYVRSWHSLVNSMIQSTGMILMKRAFLRLSDQIKEEGLDAIIVMVMHDEFQIICNKNCVDRVEHLSLQSITWAGEFYNLSIPMVGDVKSGKTWRHTH